MHLTIARVLVLVFRVFASVAQCYGHPVFYDRISSGHQVIVRCQSVWLRASRRQASRQKKLIPAVLTLTNPTTTSPSPSSNPNFISIPSFSRTLSNAGAAMKKFTFKGVLDGFRSTVQEKQKPEQEIQETLRPEHFQLRKVGALRDY